MDCCGITVKADLILMCLDVTEKEILTKEFPIFNLANFVKSLAFFFFSKSFEEKNLKRVLEVLYFYRTQVSLVRSMGPVVSQFIRPSDTLLKLI